MDVIQATQKIFYLTVRAHSVGGTETLASVGMSPDL